MDAALVVAVVVLAALCAYLAVRERRARRSEERIEALMAQVMKADERARREVAQTLHDQALQTLLAANQELHEAAPGRVGVMRAHEVVTATIEELREAVADLHPVTLEQGGLDTALSAAVRRFERQGGFECTLRIDPGAAGIHDELILAVARELLGNAVHHADAQHVTVDVGRHDGAVVLEISDDGRGIPPGRPEEALSDGHIGLASVTHRVEATGGSFSLESRPGAGTRARAILPG
jgi:two-component system NarL family sensor kinase